MKELLSEAITISLSDPIIFVQALGLSFLVICAVSLNFMRKGRKRKLPKPIKSKPKRELKFNISKFSLSKLFKGFRKIGTRLLNFQIEAFYIPNYRDEWGHYKYWDFQRPQRPKKILIEEDDVISKSSLSVSAVEPMPRPSVTIGKEPVKNAHEPGKENIPHNHAECERVRINVSGLTFETQIRTLNRFPKTLLGDPMKRAHFYNSETNEYFFDRHRGSFEAIMYYFQSGGVLRCPYGVNLEVFFEELDFFEIDEDVIDKLKESEGLAVEDDKNVPTNMLTRKLWLLMEYPESSLQAKIVAIISIFVITISIFAFCIETMHEFSYRINSKMVELPNEDADEEDVHVYDIRDPIFLLETVCICWFVFEILMRTITCPDLFGFCVDVMNIIDLVAILPYLLSILTYALGSSTLPKGFDANNNIIRPKLKPKGDSKGSTKASLAIFRVIRLVRVFRIFKLSRHFKGLKILGKTLKASVRELFMLVFFLTIGVVLFSSAAYFAETGVPGTKFTSIPAGFWWAVITMTTVGYGDIIPRGIYGKIIGCMCAIAGVLTISLPVPVIVSNFNTFYQRESYMGQLEQQDSDDGTVWKLTYLNQCPNRSGLAYLEPEKPKKKYSKHRQRQLKPESMWEAGTGIKESDSDEDFAPLKLKNRKRVAKNTNIKK